MSGPVLADADGPDARRVVDVAPDDSLNARMGPGSDYSVIGTFDHDAGDLGVRSPGDDTAQGSTTSATRLIGADWATGEYDLI
ncbi:MAG: hypothetical protein R6V26_07765 [Roseovarius sp.]